VGAGERPRGTQPVAAPLWLAAKPRVRPPDFSDFLPRLASGSARLILRSDIVEFLDPSRLGTRRPDGKA
jgi:hypothetical protein